ncbi:pimeloyl-ACP methyl ester carboxylesterase [Allocatelliglobosispora scoriae]|uniref:Pimeloyl-ACP methyl ester carboxylesterase n=1 Tax=Allocatelliglobosispora scoriae TaxID=643052 RepID=A0A841BNV1_9ACTN|nr:alpha/beta hydrolase [Allocatelliglobosispora scoriae]MBB5869068.1 pimeloyl-ACP methyl ester carboxylesterase [Allocatelliglobosispora scoriae]
MTTPLVFVHGLGGSGLNWSQLTPLLADVGPLHVFDLAGFGLRPPSGPRSTTVQANAALVQRFIAEKVGEPAVLVGNSMGGMISILVAAANPGLVRGLALIDPTLPAARGAKIDPMVRKQFLVQLVPGLGELVIRRRIARIPARDRVAATLDLCCSDVSRISASYVEDMVAQDGEMDRVQPDRVAAHVAASRSLLRVLGRASTYQAKLDALTMPVLLVHGTHDRLVSVVNARAAAARHPEWTYVELDAGHIPHMETPDEVAAALKSWLPTLP